MQPAVAGFFAFTEITDPAGHRAYNEWHALDHLPEQYAIPGVVHGQRWVCTPRCRAARVAVDRDLDATHYVTLYLLADPLDETLAEFAALATRLSDEGRFFQARRALLSGAFELSGVASTCAAPVSASVLPWRPNRGVYVVVAAGDDAADAVDLTALGAVDGVAGTWAFEARPDSAVAGTTATVAYLDDDPVTVAARIAESAAVGVGDAVRYAGPLEAIEPGRWDRFDG